MRKGATSNIDGWIDRMESYIKQAPFCGLQLVPGGHRPDAKHQASEVEGREKRAHQESEHERCCKHTAVHVKKWMPFTHTCPVP